MSEEQKRHMKLEKMNNDYVYIIYIYLEKNRIRIYVRFRFSK